ncbi:hypothetical protein D3C80_472700 [compost metagenome]
MLQRVGGFNAMRKRAIGSEQCNAEVRTGGAHFAMGLIDKLDQLSGGDPWAQYACRRLLDPQGNVIRGLHQRNFGRRFAAAAVPGDRQGADQLYFTGMLLQAEEQRDRRGFANGHFELAARTRQPTRGQYGEEQPIGIFFLMPAKYLPLNHLRVLERADLKPGRNIGDFPLGRDHRAHHTFAGRPGGTGKIEQVAAGIEVAGVNAVVAHQALRVLNALPVFHRGDFRRVVRERLQLFQGLLWRTTANACSHVFSSRDVNVRANVPARQTFIINKARQEYLAPIGSKNDDYGTVSVFCAAIAPEGPESLVQRASFAD